jgi:hypothetical protein
MSSRRSGSEEHAVAPQTLTFLSWAREALGSLASAVESGRARGQTTVELTGRDPAGAITTTGSRSIPFLLAGPADVGGLKPGAIVGRYPMPGTIDAESDKSSHVEFVEATLPWRYSPAGNPAAGSGALHPWLALVVGVAESELTVVGSQVTLSAAVQALHPLGGATPFPWAHVQVDEAGRRVARVVSGRALDPGQDYVAVLVPAFTPAGTAAWNGTAPATVPVYDSWSFRTATPAGSFRDLAAALNPGEAHPNTGRAPVDYARLPAAADLEIRGALAPIGSTVVPLDTAIADDLAGLMTPARDDAGRPIVGLPRYGDAWLPDPGTTTWGADLNGDPRNRGVAGLGLEIGIRLQEELVDEVREHAGALEVAHQKIADLVLGLEASRSVWLHRLPDDPLRRLWTLGPALRRVVTDAGPVADLATAPDRALAAGLFSSAARRVLRAGPARTARSGSRVVDPRLVLIAANRCPVPPGARDDGVAFDTAGIVDFEKLRLRAIETGKLDFGAILEAIDSFDVNAVDDNLEGLAKQLLAMMREAAEQRAGAPFIQAFDLLIRATLVDPRDSAAVRQLASELVQFIELFWELGTEDKELIDLLIGIEEPGGKEPPCRPVDLDSLAEGVSAAFDPTLETGPARVRVLGTLEGIDPAEPLAPPEICVGLDRATWRDVEGQFVEWLLPGVGALPEDSVIALETNPLFTDSVLTGYNQQLIGELRWRNMRIAAGCTPLRRFWDRADPATGDRVDDIIGIANWPTGSDLGGPAHRPGGVSGADLVLVFRGRLFLRYPRTLLYLVSAEHAGAVDFAEDPVPGATHHLPTFQGRIGSDVNFFGFQGFPPEDIERHWVVLEEPPTGYRFYNTGEQPAPVGGDGAAFARGMFADPVRVLIRGDRLAPGGD